MCRARLPLSSLSASSLHRSHSSCAPERSARLISACLCVSCRVSPKALLAPLAQAGVRSRSARADGCLPNQSVLLSLISIFQTSIYFPLASQDQNSAELIIKALLSSAFIFSQPKAAATSKFLPSSWTRVQGGRSAEALSLRYALIAYILCIKWSIWDPNEGTQAFCFAAGGQVQVRSRFCLPVSHEKLQLEI